MARVKLPFYSTSARGTLITQNPLLHRYNLVRREQDRHPLPPKGFSRLHRAQLPKRPAPQAADDPRPLLLAAGLRLRHIRDLSP